MSMNTAASPLETALVRLTVQSLSPRSRLGHVLLLLAALAMSIVIAALLVTEPALQPRTRFAFLLMLLVGASWIAYACWVLANRKTLLASHRVIAGRMAVAFSGLFTVTTLGLGIATGQAAAWAMAATGAVLSAVAIALLLRARRRFSLLQVRLQQLERELRR
jgi:hypothetical protein